MLRWKAILENGDEVIEGEAPYDIREGESLPWRRLCEFGSNIKSLSLFDDDREIIFPTEFSRFNLNNNFEKPLSYAIQHCIEVHNILGGMVNQEYVDVVVCYNDWTRIHFISNLNGTESYILLTNSDIPIIEASTGI